MPARQETDISPSTVLVVGDHTFAWYAPAAARALRILGLDVVEFNTSKYWSNGLVGRLERRFMMGRAIIRINKELLRRASAVKPGVILTYAANSILPSTIQILTRDFWVTSYHNDNPFGKYGRKAYFRHFKASILQYDSHHVYRQENIDDYQRLGVSRVRLLMSSYLPWLYEDPELGMDRLPQINSIVFIGHPEWDRRVDYLRAIIGARLPLRVYGSNAALWRKILGNASADSEPIRPVNNLDYVRAIQCSKINLCFFSAGNGDQYTRRAFEIPAAGGFLLSERTPVMETLYREGQEAEYFSSTSELVDKCRYYLKYESARQRVAREGHRRCVTSGYDIISRMGQWWADIEEWKSQQSPKIPDLLERHESGY